MNLDYIMIPTVAPCTYTFTRPPFIPLSDTMASTWRVMS